jgi:hypothetical protein
MIIHNQQFIMAGPLLEALMDRVVLVFSNIVADIQVQPLRSGDLVHEGLRHLVFRPPWPGMISPASLYLKQT